jgi:hypothetical protein
MGNQLYSVCSKFDDCILSEEILRAEDCGSRIFCSRMFGVLEVTVVQQVKNRQLLQTLKNISLITIQQSEISGICYGMRTRGEGESLMTSKHSPRSRIRGSLSPHSIITSTMNITTMPFLYPLYPPCPLLSFYLL